MLMPRAAGITQEVDDTTDCKLPFCSLAHPINYNLFVVTGDFFATTVCAPLHNVAFRRSDLPSLSILAQTHPSTQTHAASPSRLLEGNYAGTLQAAEAQLHLVLHLTKSANGSLHATLDSLDQAVYAIEATSISFSATTLKFEVASAGAHFEGKVSADHQTIDGEWAQGNVSLPLVFHRQAANAGSRKPSEAIFPVEGNWQTALESHGLRLRYQLHVSHDTEGELVAALDNLDQSVIGLPAVRVSLKEDNTFHFEIPSVAGIFEGTFRPREKYHRRRLVSDGRRAEVGIQALRPTSGTPPPPDSCEALSVSRRRSLFLQCRGKRHSRRNTLSPKGRRAISRGRSYCWLWPL